MITAVGVVIPARDEAEMIAACLRSVKRSLAALPDSVDTAIWVVLDHCTDGTGGIVRRSLSGFPNSGWETAPAGDPVGAVRHRGHLSVLRLLRGHSPARVWLMSTDADTVVPPGWVAAHLERANRGADAVAGVADLAADAALEANAAAAYAELIARHRHGDEHDHVYGANLGVRASAYLQVGGFPPLASGEDVQLARRLRTAGLRVESPAYIRVYTSARIEGRARGGLADLLAELSKPAG